MDNVNCVSNIKFSLFDICNYNANLEDKDYFVGIKCENEKLQINFPLGYKKAENEQELRKDILTLIKVLSVFNGENIARVTNVAFRDREKVQFPIHAYLYIIRDFLTNGYYVEKESFFVQSKTGKINWNKTIKNIKPIVSDEVVYLDFITRKTNYDENQLITKIHQYCVFESFNKLGWLFSSLRPRKPNVVFNKNLFTTIIKTKLSQTFNEKILLLFNYMLDIVEHLGKSNDQDNFFFGTENFAYVWECIVDKTFGVNNKQKYYPHIFWDIGGRQYSSDDTEYARAALRPDTIMILNENTANQELFVLDSKYYKYGVSKIPCHLPMSGSIVKQIAYAEFIDKKECEGKLYKSKSIYNAFILPYEAKNELELMKYVGTATTDYTIGDKGYHKIKAILIDTKYLMSNYNKGKSLSKMLGNEIKKQFLSMPL